MKLWTNNTNAVTVVDDNKLWPRCSYILPDELVNPPFTDGIPVPHLIKPYYPGRAEGGTTAVYRAGAIGDSFMATGVIRYLIETSGGCGRCLLSCPQYASLCWAGSAGVALTTNG